MNINMQKSVIELISTLGDGGAETLVKDYAIMLNALNVKTDIITVYKVSSSSNLTKARNAGISVNSLLPGYNLFYRLLKQTIGFFIIPLLILRIIKKRDVVCIHVHMNQLHHIYPIMRFIKDVKVLYTCHNDPNKYFHGLSGKLEYKAVKKMLKHDSFTLIALHNTMADELKSMFNTSNVIVIKNGVDFTKFLQLNKTREDKRKEIGIAEDAYVIGHIGRFSNQKNHTFLIDIFANISKKKDNAFLLLIGSGQLENEVVEKLERLHLDGRYMILSHRTDIPELLKTMDVFLFPSLYEGLPVSLIEAQVAKLHCVVSDVINKALLLPSTVSLSLNDSVDTWSEECIKRYDNIVWNDRIMEYDMNREIIKLKEFMIDNIQ